MTRLKITWVQVLWFVPMTTISAGEFEDREQWLAAVGDVTTIDFTGFASQFLTDQYRAMGVLFTDGNDMFHFSPGTFHDDWGVDGNGNIVILFNAPQAWIAADFPGTLRFELYADGRLVCESELFGGGGVGFFGGVISPEPFDLAILIDLQKSDQAAIDDLHFGRCGEDLNEDGGVGITDLLALIGAWGDRGSPAADFDGDNTVGIADLLMLLARWGPCPARGPCPAPA